MPTSHRRAAQHRAEGKLRPYQPRAASSASWSLCSSSLLRDVWMTVPAHVASMVLLSQPIRTAAITGRTDNLAEWFAGRQGGRWAEQMVRSAVPPAGAPRPGPPPHAPQTSPSGPDPADTLRELTELHQRGVLTDAEFEGLRAHLRG